MTKAHRPAIRGKPEEVAFAVNSADKDSAIDKLAVEQHRPPTRQKRE